MQNVLDFWYAIINLHETANKKNEKIFFFMSDTAKPSNNGKLSIALENGKFSYKFTDRIEKSIIK